MTVAEASRIVRQFENGTLDPELPGTIDLVNEAHRVRLHQYMWGPYGAPRPPSPRHRLIVVAGCAIITLGSSILSFLFVATAR
ncbi:hypothetical protein [Leifsonia sp. SIMBA_070]|uniref:hypothetical protein n=1 Tax=Leifsonia sp. SIMBA_070 TaxID=3085810 RepID=UPI003978125C